MLVKVSEVAEVAEVAVEVSSGPLADNLVSLLWKKTLDITTPRTNIINIAPHKVAILLLLILAYAFFFFHLINYDFPFYSPYKINFLLYILTFKY